jgi:hypothetical protein
MAAIEDQTDRQSELRRDPEERTDENLTREHQREPSAVEWVAARLVA